MLGSLVSFCANFSFRFFNFSFRLLFNFSFRFSFSFCFSISLFFFFLFLLSSDEDVELLLEQLEDELELMHFVIHTKRIWYIFNYYLPWTSFWAWRRTTRARSRRIPFSYFGPFGPLPLSHLLFRGTARGAGTGIAFRVRTRRTIRTGAVFPFPAILYEFFFGFRFNFFVFLHNVLYYLWIYDTNVNIHNLTSVNTSLHILSLFHLQRKKRTNIACVILGS